MDPRTGELTALGIVEVPEDVALSEGATRARQARRLLQKVLDFAPRGDADPAARADRAPRGRGDRRGGPRDRGRPHHLRLGRPRGRPRRRTGDVFSPTIDAVVREPPCDIAVVKQRPFGEVRRILVPVRGGPHAELALEFADALARRHDARIVVLHVIPPGVTARVRAQAEHALATFLKQHARGHADGVLREAPNVRNAILREAERADVVVMGASAAPEGTDRRGVPLRRAARSRSPPGRRPPVIVVKTRERDRPGDLRGAGRAGRVARRRRPRRRGVAGGPRPRGALVRRIQLPPRRVPQPAPPRRAQATAGTNGQPHPTDARRGGDDRRDRARARERVLMDGVPLVDELLVIDSASTDRTREIAEAEGARVVQHPDVLPRYGSYRGKGEALWKSLYETSGDLVAWCDTDVRNWHPRMAYGTLGPLLAEPRIQYVKGYYQRPIVEDGHPQGGRRRAGHRARRAAAHQPLLPRPVGLHPAALRRVRRAPDAPRVDPVLHRLRGRDRPPHRHRRARRASTGLGQVDLERRVHRNQELEGLSRMSFVILQAVMKRLEERRQGPPLRRARLDDEAAALRRRPPRASRSSSWPTASARR